MIRVRRITSTDVRRFLQNVLDDAAAGAVVIIETTKARHPRAVIISVERAHAAGILPVQENK